MPPKTTAKGLQTLPDKRGKIKNCTQGKSYPCGKACLGMGSDILSRCLKGLKASDAQKASEVAKSLLNNKQESQYVTKTSKQVEGNTEIKIKGDLFKTLLGGRKTTTPEELNAIGIRKKDNDDIELSSMDIDRLNQIRNGYNSFEEFLKSDPKEHILEKDLTLFVTDRVKMKIDSYGNIDFTIDGTFDAGEINKDKPKPIKELVQMAKSWEQYANSEAGERIFTNTPYYELDEDNNRFESRKKTYEKFGFKTNRYNDAQEYISAINEEVLEVGQVLDNRKPNSDLNPSEFYETIGQHIASIVSFDDVQKQFKEKYMNFSQNKKKEFMKADSVDKIIKLLGVNLPRNWETQQGDNDDDGLTKLAKVLTITESNLNANNKTIDTKTLLWIFPNDFVQELINS